MNMPYKINDMSIQIRTYHETLDLMAAWLMLASITILSSVEKYPVVALVGCLVIAWFYARKVLDHVQLEHQELKFDGWDVSITKAIRHLEDEIKNNYQGAEQAELLDLLKVKCNDLLKFKNFYKYKQFVAAFFFWAVALAYSVFGCLSLLK